MKKKAFLMLAIMLLAAALCVSACGNGQEPADQPGDQPADQPGDQPVGEGEGLELVIARYNDVTGFDPCYLTGNGQVIDNIYDRLLMRDGNMELQPGLATAWEMIDEYTWEFTLRQGVTFHNGAPFTAADVEFTISRIIAPDSGSTTVSYLKTIDHVEVVDEYTVRIVTTEPDPLILTRLSRYPSEILCKSYVEEVGNEVANEQPIGTGPYIFQEWAKDDYVILTSNVDYWNGVPEVTKVTWRCIPETSTRVSSLIAGEIDIAVAITASELPRIEEADNTYVSTAERAGNIVYVGLKTDEAPFDNPLVRQAMNYAVDVDAIVENVLGGAAVTTNSIIGPYDFGYVGEYEDWYEYDPDKARELLAEAGYADGFTANMDTVTWYLNCSDVGQAVAGYLAEVGINVTVNAVESSVYSSSVPAHTQAPMYFLGWSSTNSLDADAAIYSVLHSQDPYSTYYNSEMDAMLDAARSCMDETERAELYKQISDKVMEECPRIFLYQENKYYGCSEDIDFSGRIDDAIVVFDVHAK